MEAKEAVQRAKAYVIELFGADGIADLRLEEIEHEEGRGIWSVTLGFLRRRETAAADGSPSGLMAALQSLQGQTRAYRVVRIRESDGMVLSVKTRDRAVDAA